MTMIRTTAVLEDVQHQEVCSVHIGDELFAVRLTDVVEVTANTVLRDCPLSPAYVAGLMQYRGDVLTVVCLRTLLEMQPCSGAENVVVMNSEHGLFALLVDRIGEVLAVDADSYEPVPATVETQRQELFSGTFQLEHRLLTLLNIQRLEPSALRSQRAQVHLRP